ncbi:MAG: hypothetical protein JST93_13870 [Acidobacteria bacterium]|nr:hypothetical protein [Acidobacteriota bacterium]
MESRKRIRRTTAPSRVGSDAPAQAQFLPNIVALIDAGGDVTVGALYPIKCVASASDSHRCLAMLKRRPRETLSHLLERLDAAIELAEANDTMTDEVNVPVQNRGTSRR